MTEARVKSFCKNVSIDIGYFTGKEILPRSCKEGNKCLYLSKSQFCVIWKSEGVSLLKATEEVKNSELRSACLLNDIGNAYEKYFFQTKMEKQLNNVIITIWKLFLEIGKYHMVLVVILFQKYWQNMIEIWRMKRLKNIRVIVVMADCIRQMF